ncbi:MAG: RsmE family RNA methyltransferase [Phycisphaerales bacterium]
MAIHRIYLDDPAALAPGALEIGGEEARHAVRVKRLEPGNPIEVLDGAGRVGLATIADIDKPGGEWLLSLVVGEVRPVEPTRPRLDVLCPAPKGPRLSELIDGLSQAGAASWSALTTEHTAREPGEVRLDRVRRIAAEASKQCGRAWTLLIGEPVEASDVLAQVWARQALVMADASGGPYAPCGSEAITLMIGPEGGWSARELDGARAAGIAIARFGPHTMRVETAAVAAVAVILDLEARRGS